MPVTTVAPTIGRIVLFRSRTGNYTVPAIVNATQDTLYRPGVDGGFVPDLSSGSHVHLTVLTPGKPGKRATVTDFVAPSAHPVGENVAGCYQEWDVPEGDGPGTWAWPPRVGA